MKTYKKVLTIAGSDSGGGAGIQADLKAIAACGCHGMTAITAVTVQNTMGVTGIHPIPLDIVEAQIRAVIEDIGVDAVKIGMLHSAEIIRLVSGLLKMYHVRNIVVDPVMVTASGHKLLQDEAIATLFSDLFPLADVITPNLYEAQIISGIEIQNQEHIYESAKKMEATKAKSVLVKAGHLDANPFYDVWYDFNSGRELRLATIRIETPNTNGTGCTFSSAIAAFLAQGNPLDKAVQKAHNYLHKAIECGALYKIGHGHGNIHHFSDWWE